MLTPIEPAASISSAILASMALYCTHARDDGLSAHRTNDTTHGQQRECGVKQVEEYLLEEGRGGGRGNRVLDEADLHHARLAKLLRRRIKLERPVSCRGSCRACRVVLRCRSREWAQLHTTRYA